MSIAKSLVVFICIFTSACQSKETINGYIENQSTKLSVPIPAKLESHLQEGSSFKVNDVLATLSSKDLNYSIQSQKSAISSLEYELKNIQKGLRGLEQENLQFKLNIAKSNKDYAFSHYHRINQLNRKNYETQSSIELAIRNKMNADNLYRISQNEVALGLNGAREDLIKSLESKIKMQLNMLKKLEAQHEDLTLKAPFDGVLERVLIESNERVAAYHPVITLVNPKDTKVIFYLDEKQLSKVKVGGKIKVIPPFSKDTFDAIVQSVASKPEFTPPILFDQGRDSPYSFRVKAKMISNKAVLHSGQPVVIELTQ